MTATTAPVVLDPVTCRQHLAAAIADAGPDHVYERVGGIFCVYAAITDRSAEPVRCIIGEILHRAGVPNATLRQLVGSFSALADAGELDVVAPLVIDPRLIGPLAEIQRLQDENHPWGELLAVFDAAVGVEPCGACGQPAVETRSYWPGSPAKPRCAPCAASAQAQVAAYERTFAGARSPWS